MDRGRFLSKYYGDKSESEDNILKNITEEQFKAKGLEFFKKLEEKTKLLKVDLAVGNDSQKLIDEGKVLFSQGNTQDALKKYTEARDLITQTISSRSEPLARRLLCIEFCYLFILLLIGYLINKWPGYGLWKGIINQSLQTAWFGALGGITIAIYGIYSHIQQKDFDPNYQLWYLCKPVIGAIFGWFVYLIFFLGLVSVQGMNQQKMARPELAFLIAFLAGFSERFTIKMIDKVMSVLITWEDKETETKK
jgi:tetratricopeptide (TPR) repeat protein